MTGYNGHLGWNQLQRARDLGARVILDGTDGDSTVSYGNGYCRELATAGQWGALLQELAGAVSMHGIRTVRPFLRLVWTYGLRPRMPERLMKVRKLVGGRRQKPEPPENANPDERWDYLNADFLNRIGLIDLRKQEEAQKRFISSRDSHWKLVSSGRLPMLLDLLEHCASAFGIECRLPFCDRKLAEFCLAVPTRLKRHRSLDRYIMRHSLGDVLPKEVSQRPLKTDLTDVFVQAIKNHDREMWKNQYGHSLKAIEPYIDTEFFRGFSERFSRGALNALELRLAWRSMILGLWFREKIFSHDLPG